MVSYSLGKAAIVPVHMEIQLKKDFGLLSRFAVFDKIEDLSHTLIILLVLIILAVLVIANVNFTPHLLSLTVLNHGCTRQGAIR